MAEFSVGHVADEDKSRHRVEPPVEPVDSLEPPHAQVLQNQRDGVAPRRPERQSGLLVEFRRGDAEPFDEKSLEKD